MKYRNFGSTGLQVSEIVFGAGAVGGVVFRPDRDTRLEAIRRAMDHGINWIDTAPVYGDGQSEENLGWVLQRVGASPHVSTKVRINPEDLDDIPGAVERSMDRSLKRLRRDSVDVIQLHTPITQERGTLRDSVTVEDVLGDNGVITGFERLRRGGKTRFFGFTGFGDTESLHTLINSGQFQSVQAYYNLLNPSAGRTMPEGFAAHDYKDLIGLAAGKGMGVLNIRVLAAGAIAGQRPPGAANSAGLSPGSSAEADMARSERLREVLADEPGTPAQSAIRFGLMNPGVSGVLVGFARVEHIEEAVKAVDMDPLPESVLGRLEPLYQSDFAA